MEKLSKIKLIAFRNQLRKYVEQEEAIRKSMRSLYDRLILDTEDDKLAQRHVRQEYFRIQKDLLSQVVKDRLEFHPFFGAANLASLDEDNDNEEDDDFIL